jgi:dTDP-glucose pyrophosphorylase
MFIIIPLGGKGERFKKEKYILPKALIPIFGKPILYYLLDNLDLKNIDFVYIPYHKDYQPYNLEGKLIQDYPYIVFKFYKLEFDTEGAAHTLNLALKQLKIKDQPILSLDCDNFFINNNIVQKWNGENKLICILDTDTNPIYSYLNINEQQEIIDIKEKVKISDYACTGAYGFSSYKTLLKYSQIILDKKIKQKNEYYISNIISYMIQEKIKFKPCLIKKEEWICLGTPNQVLNYIQK